MSESINRRDFLKFSSVFPFLAGNWSSILEKGAGFSSDPSSPNILVILFDALSAKNVSLYGYGRPTTPNLERIAARSIVYHNHYSTANFTTPGTASLLTGTYPWQHRAIHFYGTVEKSVAEKNLFQAFANSGYTRLAYSHNLLVTYLLYQFYKDIEIFKWPRALSLADFQISDRLFPRDYNAAITSEMMMGSIDTSSSGSLILSLISRWMMGEKNRDLKRELKEIYPEGISEQNGHFYILEPAIDWIMDQVGKLQQPYLAYIHLLPPHEPYVPRYDFAGLFTDNWKPLRKPKGHFTQGYSQQDLNHFRRSYDEFILNVDAEFGRLFDFLDRNGILDNTCVILTTDHGELFERGIKAHSTPALYQPLVQIPLMMMCPGQMTREDVYLNTSSIDILPTLLHLAGLEIPEWVQGQILPPFGVTSGDNSRPLFCMEAKTNPKLAPLQKGSFAVIKGDYKLMHYRGYDLKKDPPDYEMFNLAEDPEELTDIHSSQKAIASELKDILHASLEQADQMYAL